MIESWNYPQPIVTVLGRSQDIVNICKRKPHTVSPKCDNVIQQRVAVPGCYTTKGGCPWLCYTTKGGCPWLCYTTKDGCPWLCYTTKGGCPWLCYTTKGGCPWLCYTTKDGCPWLLYNKGWLPLAVIQQRVAAPGYAIKCLHCQSLKCQCWLCLITSCL